MTKPPNGLCSLTTYELRDPDVTTESVEMIDTKAGEMAPTASRGGSDCTASGGGHLGITPLCVLCNQKSIALLRQERAFYLGFIWFDNFMKML